MVISWIVRNSKKSCMKTSGVLCRLRINITMTHLFTEPVADGQASFMELRGMVDTPFPFPFAQLIEVLLFAFTILLPITAAGYLYSPVLVWIFTLTTVLAFRTVNEVRQSRISYLIFRILFRQLRQIIVDVIAASMLSFRLKRRLVRKWT